jgi:SAM-dependent methyltransferase
MWDRIFSETEWSSAPDPFLCELAAGLEPGRALDVGSGPGRNGLWLAEQGWHVTLLDPSQVALTQAEDRAQSLAVNVSTLRIDVDHWQPEPKVYDLVVIANLHMLEAELSSLYHKAHDSLRDGGHLYVVGHHLSSLGRHGPPDPERLFTPERLRRVLGAGFEVEMLEERERSQVDDRQDEPDPTPDRVVVLWARAIA